MTWAIAFSWLRRFGAWARRHWKAIAVVAVILAVGFGIAKLARQAEEIDQLEHQVDVERANAAADRDSVRVIYEDSVRQLSARLAAQRELSEEQAARAALVPGLRAQLEEKDQRIAGLVRRVIQPDSVKVESAAPVTDSADVRHASFEEELPGGGRIYADTWLAPDSAWATLGATLPPCILTDYTAVGDEGAEVELYQFIEGPCDGAITETPVLDLTPEPADETPWYRDGDFYTGTAVGAATTAILGFFIQAAAGS